MSALGGKADIADLHCECPLMTQSGQMSQEQNPACEGSCEIAIEGLSLRVEPRR
jgi:hypothetical protein